MNQKINDSRCFEKSTPKEESSSTKTMQPRTQSKNKAVFKGRKRGIIGPSSI
ncbi:unnamed protein product [Acanthoscelides obtectus]|uniref:Uncharacterized protein n=1 Tax=Acanthoscelides obtectus TaxID=200917 RepID=A0A9P0KY26_ACAOB|nr:unnamed protein product [Acanthoscelides obtectus]CAK1650818.1 hypothetical protein AOBTE_LOCUS16915 [Acanthoscelides obtectus]